VVINDIHWPPYFMINAQKEGTGFAKETINLCLQHLGYKIEYNELPVKRTHYFMKNGDIDITVYSYKEERKEFLYYAKEVLFNSEYGFLVRANSDIQINDLTDLDPLIIGNLAGLTYTPELKKIIDNKIKREEVVTGYSLKAMFAQLLAETPRFDIMADSKSTFFWEAKKLGVSDRVKVLDYNIKNKAYYITVSKRSKNIKNPQEFLTKMDVCVSDMKKSAEYQERMIRYGFLTPRNSHSK
jgi:polar amino acid transport system substrate-binding protein